MPDKYARQESGGEAAVDEITTSAEAANGAAAKVTEHRVSHVDGESATEVTTFEETRHSPRRNRNLIIVAAFAALALVVVVLLLWSRGKPADQEKAGAEAAQGGEKTSVTN